ncbi:hypothetical protein [Streptosporangium sp. NPDC049078]|uniref:hypothetical protein n=1 Tax=Streptosporangium sp. NPDC049078 TaxID=3155767 RepID=UPI003444309A
MSQTSTPSPDPPSEPSRQDISRGLAALESHLAEHAPSALPAPREHLEADGETKRVRQLRAEVAEAHLLAELQDDDAPLMLDTARVRKRRRAAWQAARLHALAQDPATRAWQVTRMRRLLVAVAMVALALALGWSTAGVHAFAAEGAEKGAPGWVFAWLVEPFMSLALLVVVGARAYLATLGQPIESRVLIRIEWLFLGLTLGMNAWPYLPWSLPSGEEFSFSRLVLHILGPVVAVAIVTALPIILAAFTRLDLGLSGTPLTAARYRENADSGNPSGTPLTGVADVEAKAARIRHLIATGELPEEPGVKKIRDALSCRMATAQAVRDRLAEGGGWNSAIDEEYR